MFTHLLALVILPALALSQTIPIALSGNFTDATTLVVSLDPHEITLTSNLTLPLADTKQPPTFSLGDSDGINTSAVYTIVCIDPDAPANVSAVLHYLNTNYSPSGNGTQLVSDNTSPIVEWAPPGPPEGTGSHRYIFLLFRQRPRDGFEVQGIEEGVRIGFNVEEWWELNQLEAPIAGAVFLANADDQGAVGGDDEATTTRSTGSSSAATSAATSAAPSGAADAAPPATTSASGEAGADANGDGAGSAAGRSVAGLSAVLGAAVAGVVWVFL